MPLLRDYVNSEVEISEANLRDLLASFLYQTHTIDDSDEVVELHLSPERDDGLRTIRYRKIKSKEPELLIHS